MSGICKVSYPLYCCSCLDDESFIVAGGGGAAKTGVQNYVEVLELKKDKRRCVAQSVGQLNTDIHAAMSMAVSVKNGANSNVSPDDKCLLALSLDKKCCIYSLQKVEDKAAGDQSNQASGLTKRKKGSAAETKKEASQGIPLFQFKLLHDIDVVPSKNERQYSVQLNSDGSLLASGGSDGHVRVWKLPTKEKVFDVHGHKDDVTDLDISPDSKQVVSVSRDKQAFLWDVETGHKISELHLVWNMEMLTRNYRFRNCRFGIIPERTDRYVLFTTHSPLQQNAKDKSTQCCITKWARKRDKEGNEVGDLMPAIMQKAGREAISSFTVSQNGVFLGVGFMEGSIAIYIAFSLQCAHRVQNVHSIYVTSLSFVKDTDRTMALTGACDAALISVSGDCTCQLTKLNSRTMFSLWFVILLCILTLVGVAIYLHSVGVL